jgi:hypothetical protein
MDLPELCEKLTRANHLDATKKAIAILWLKSQEKDGGAMPIRAITKIFSEHRLGNPNRGVLSKGLSSSPLTLKTDSGFVLKAGAGETVSAWLAHVLGNAIPNVNQAEGYLPEAVWLKTRDYVERVCTQLNGCYYYGFFDAAAVMVRRLMETLVIEAFEHANRPQDIRDSQGFYFMFGDLVQVVTGPKGLSLSRESKSALQQIKKLGDRAAHNRRFNAVKVDLDGVKDGTRVASEDLINIAALRHK